MIKRIIDFKVSGILILILSPLFLLISFLIKLDSEGPVFYKSSRIGKDGKPFQILKFRSMIKDAELKGSKITTKNDSRITHIGKILRNTKLDELPNLVNVLIGELSLVGPRPEVPEYVEKYSPREREVLKLKPGITGPSQLKYINESSHLHNLSKDYPQILSDKLTLDIEYLKNASLIFDIKILFSTLKALFVGTISNRACTN
ncbi:sugar transferase [candidate division WOR-3 bacterium]|nr:sugar transferase [candidate division WOR-3 bacterium]